MLVGKIKRSGLIEMKEIRCMIKDQNIVCKEIYEGCS